MKRGILLVILALALAWPVLAADGPTIDTGAIAAEIKYSKILNDMDSGTDFVITVSWPYALIQDVELGKLLEYDLVTHRLVNTFSFPSGRFMMFAGPGGQIFMLGSDSIWQFEEWASARSFLEKGTGTAPKTIPLTGVRLDSPGRQYRFKVGPAGTFFIHDRKAQTLYACAKDGTLINSYPCPSAFVPMPGGSYITALDQKEKGILIEETQVVSRSSMTEQKEVPGISRRVFLDSGIPTLVGMESDGSALLLLYPPMPEVGDEETGAVATIPSTLFQGSDTADIRMVVMRVDTTGHATPFISVPLGEGDGMFDIATGSLWHLQPAIGSEGTLIGLNIRRKPL
ncbi:MAG TPA: hypothetical protein PKM25_00815 [Candidatus Ozemobacteraceae bacterium]|nr:hypothetical protein [Candidatus Ozemobacteraceae bacterium]